MNITKTQHVSAARPRYAVNSRSIVWIQVLCLVKIFWVFSSVVQAQDSTSEGSKSMPSELETVFDDNFLIDTSTSYRLNEAVSWQQGQLLLKNGAFIERDIEGGAWAKVDISKQLIRDKTPGSEEQPPTSELRIWFILNGATSCYVRLMDQQAGGQPVHSIALVDTGTDTETPIAQITKEAKRSGLSPNRLSLEYRHGVLLVATADGSSFVGHLANGSASVKGIRLEAVKSDISLQSLKVATKPRQEKEYTTEEKQQLEKSELLNRQMFALYQQGKFAEATKLGEQVLKITKEVMGEDHPENAINLRNIGQMYWIMGDYPRAITLTQQACEVQKPVLGENHPDYANTLHNLALLYSTVGDIQQAEQLYQKSLTIHKAANGEESETYATVLMNLARLYDVKGNFALAERLFLRTLEIRKQVVGVEHASYASSLNGLAALYYQMGSFAQAEPLLKESLAIRKSSLGENHPDYAVSLSNMGALYERMGDYARAVPLYEQSGEIQKAVVGESHPSYANVLNSLAVLYKNLGDYARSEHLHKRALEIRKQAYGEHHPIYAGSLNNLASLYSDARDFDQAEPLFRKALAIYGSSLGESHPDYATSLNTLGLMFYEKGDYEQARPLFETANAIEKEVVGEQHPLYAISLHNLAATHAALKDYEPAAKYSAQAVEIVRQNLDTNSFVQSERQQKRNQTSHRNFLDLQLAIQLELDPTSHEALQSLWRWRGAVTFRQGAYRQAASSEQLAPTFDALRMVSRQLSKLSGKYPKPPAASASAAEQEAYRQARSQWNAQFAALRQNREDLEQKIALDSNEFRTLREPITVEDVQASLTTDAAYIEFFEYNNGLPGPSSGKSDDESHFLAVVIRQGHLPRMLDLGSAGPITEQIATFRRLMYETDSESENLAEESRQNLREILWLPVEQHLSGITTVILSPDTSLGTLPCAALPGREPGSFLIEDYRIASIPYASLLRTLPAKPQPNQTRGLLAVGDVDYDSVTSFDGSKPNLQELALAREQGRLANARGLGPNKWQALPGFREELNIVLGLHKERFGEESRVRTLSGTEATESELLQLAPQYATLHLITHGFFSRSEVTSLGQAVGTDSGARERTHSAHWLPGLLSGLVLAGANQPSNDPTNLNDGILRAAEIEASLLQGVDLVVLSACETGLGAVAGGEGLTGLQRAFHVAGARNVIASLWKVDDRATQELMRRFYTNLWIKKQSKMDALRNAQLWMLRHPEELAGLGVKEVTARGTPRRLAVVRQSNEGREAASTHPYFWAAFQLSGSFR